MKNKVSGFLKQLISMITTMAKSKTMALKSKTRAIKTRLVIFSLLRNKKILMTTITDKLRALIGQEEKKHLEEDEFGKGAIVLYNAMSQESLPNPTHSEFLRNEEEYGYGYDHEDDDDKYPDLTHSLFQDDGGGSVIDIVKNSKPEGEEFKLEDEIDHVADLFIQRFHRQMRIQKQLSFKRYQEMLERAT